MNSCMVFLAGLHLAGWRSFTSCMAVHLSRRTVSHHVLQRDLLAQALEDTSMPAQVNGQ